MSDRIEITTDEATELISLGALAAVHVTDREAWADRASLPLSAATALAARRDVDVAELLAVDPAPSAPQTVEEVIADVVAEVRDRYPRLPTDAPSEEVAEAVVEALREGGWLR